MPLGIRTTPKLDAKRWKWMTYLFLVILCHSIELGSFGFVAVDWDTNVLFSAWIEE